MMMMMMLRAGTPCVPARSQRSCERVHRVPEAQGFGRVEQHHDWSRRWGDGGGVAGSFIVCLCHPCFSASPRRPCLFGSPPRPIVRIRSSIVSASSAASTPHGKRSAMISLKAHATQLKHRVKDAYEYACVALIHSDTEAWGAV